MTLGQRIQELRKQAGMSQESLGEALGVSRQAVSKWEGDNGIPELDTLIAMSRLFGVTLGQLLGVEEPAPTEEESTSTMDEEKVEAILRRYVEESRQRERNTRTAIWVKLAAICCVAAVGIVALVSTSQIREIKQSVNTLWSNVAGIESTVTNMRNQMGNLSTNIRDQVSAALEEKNNLISTFEYEVYGVDLKGETVDVRFSATLKEYTAGSQVQFVLNWLETDETEGQTITDAVDGPDFEVEVTIPMNFHLEVSIRELLPDGGHREQKVDTIYSGMHPNNFSFEVGGIFDPLRLSMYHWSGTQTDIKHFGHMSIYSGWNETSGNDGLLWPVSVRVKYVLTNPKAGTEKTEESYELVLEDDNGDGIWSGTRENYLPWTVFAGAQFDATVTIVDNLGRTFTFRDSSYVDAKGEWPEAPGSIRLDQEPEVTWTD